jgi:glycerol-3-phosphate dehydrogenase (NAD(P)+)
MSMVAEGYYATRGIYEIAYEKKLKTPIINAIFSVLYEGKDAEKQFEKLTAKLN